MKCFNSWLKFWKGLSSIGSSSATAGSYVQSSYRGLELEIPETATTSNMSSVEAVCAGKGGRLISPDSEEKMKEIKALIELHSTSFGNTDASYVLGRFSIKEKMYLALFWLIFRLLQVCRRKIKFGGMPTENLWDNIRIGWMGNALFLRYKDS